MRISDWSSDVCSSDLPKRLEPPLFCEGLYPTVNAVDAGAALLAGPAWARFAGATQQFRSREPRDQVSGRALHHPQPKPASGCRSEEHTSELQSLMRISYAVFCLKKKTKT